MLELAVREKACVVAIAETELHALSDALIELLIEALEQPVIVPLRDAEVLSEVLNDSFRVLLAQPVLVLLPVCDVEKQAVAEKLAEVLELNEMLHGGLALALELSDVTALELAVSKMSTASTAARPTMVREVYTPTHYLPLAGKGTQA